MDSDVLNRLQRLEDVALIRQLKHAYCYACDDNYNVEKLKKLFTVDAIWEANGFGQYKGPDEIAAFFRGVSEKIVAAAHLVMNDMIEISDDGNSASGIWRNSQPVTVRAEDGSHQAMWMLARYDEVYVKQDGRWYFKKLQATIQYSAPYEKGWAALWPHH
jgi:ketosteroid isomerase-like protein